MIKSNFNKVTIGLISSVLFVFIISFTYQANAQTPPPLIPTTTSGKYSNQDFGVQITFPNSWRATEVKTGAATTVSAFQQDQEITNGGSTSASVITLTMMPKPTEAYADPNLPADPKINCDVTSTSNANIHGMNALVTITECVGPDQEIKMKGYSFQTGRNLIILNYMAMPSSLYEGNVANFDSIADTLQIANTVGAPSGPQTSGTHPITNSSSAVPEFPVGVVVVLVVMMSFVAILGKTRLSNFNIK